MANLNLLFYRNPVFDKCPNCDKMGTLHRSRARGSWEQFLKNFTIFKLYRCKNCGWRGKRSTIIYTKRTVKNIFIYLVLAGIAAVVIRLVLTKFIR